MYPNPASSSFNVEIPAKLSGTEVQLIDNTGKTLYSERINKTNFTINLTDYKPGIYILKINTIIRQIIVK